MKMYEEIDMSEENKSSMWEVFIAFFKIGILTFGGGLAMLPMFKRECVHNHHWMTEEEILDMYAISQCTPGIIAVNTATYVGYREGGIWGGIVATLGVVAPSLVIICLVASVLNQFIMYPVVQHALAGIRVIVCALMIETVVSMTKSGVKDLYGVIILCAAFLAATFTSIPLVLIVVISGIIGICIKKMGGNKS